MKNFLLYIFLSLFLCNFSLSEEISAKCKGRDVKEWSNCKGVEKWQNGSEYVGEFKNGKKVGEWTEYYLICENRKWL